ncbi:MAG: hypothetical protein ABR503_04765 [Chitinophagaceae bacterium]
MLFSELAWISKRIELSVKEDLNLSDGRSQCASGNKEDANNFILSNLSFDSNYHVNNDHYNNNQ